MVDQGADAVICCHTHCPLPWEIYADRPIVYGLGNLIFEPFRKPHTSWQEGYLAKLTIEDKHVSFEAIPYFQSKAIPGAQKMAETSIKSFLDEMEKKCAQIKDAVFLEAQWLNYCCEQKDLYPSGLFCYNKLMRKGDKYFYYCIQKKKYTGRCFWCNVKHIRKS